MNAVFHFNRIKLLTIRYFTEHGRRDLVTLIAFFLTFAFLPRLSSDPSDYNTLIIFGIILFVGGMRFTARIFHEIHSSDTGMHYLHIPASRLEKYILNGALTLIVYPIICLLLFYGGTLFGNLVKPLIPSFINYRTIELSSLISMVYIKKMAIQYVSWQAIFFMGSLVFKKHPTTKTLLSIFLFSLVTSIILSLTVKIVWTDSIVTPETLIFSKVMNLLHLILDNSTLWIYLKYLLFASLVLFFWIISYFKLKEKQV